MADPRHAPLSFRPTPRVARDEEFDDSVFDRAARSVDGAEEELGDGCEDGEDGEDPEPPPAREGLPASYRMRHDAHYVEQIASRRHGEPVHLVPIAEIDGAHALTPPHALQPLVQSVAKLGVLQPLLVRRVNGRYALIAGARRLAAAAAAGLKEVPCLLHPADDERARQLSEAVSLSTRGSERRAPAADARLALAPGVFSDLTEHLGAIGACLHLFGERDRPLRERVAMGLVQAEVQRAAWLSQALAVLVADPPLACNPVDLGAVVGRLAATLTPERVLAGVDVVLECADERCFVRGDEQLLSIALAGMSLAVHALVERVAGARIRVAVSPVPASRRVRVEVSEDILVIPASWRARFFDLAWPERPGGLSVGAGLVAARRVAELHGGSLDLAAVPGGCALLLQLDAE